MQRLHCESLHGGVSLTMAVVRERLDSQAKAFNQSRHPRVLGLQEVPSYSSTHTTTWNPPERQNRRGYRVQVIGVDFAGPIKYKKTCKKEGKAYLALFACSLSRAIQLELLPNMETETFIPCLKRLIARRGRPRVIYSDNGGTFVKTAKWLTIICKDERLQGFLENQEIQWKFNLSQAPWWGGQFERLIGVVKGAMYKTIGDAMLSWSELSEVILDVET